LPSNLPRVHHRRTSILVEHWRLAGAAPASAQLCPLCGGNLVRRLQPLVDDVRGQPKAAEVEGMSETGYAIYGLLKGAQVTGVAESNATYGSERVREVAAAIESAIAPQVAIVDWTKKSDVQREMRRQIKRRLPSKLYGKTEQERVAEAIVDLLKVRKKR
jgi:type I restriction enzyme R subunit